VLDCAESLQIYDLQLNMSDEADKPKLKDMFCSFGAIETICKRFAIVVFFKFSFAICFVWMLCCLFQKDLIFLVRS